MDENEIEDSKISDIEEEPTLGNFHIEIPEETKYMMDQFDTFYNNNENGGSSRWMISPNVVKDWVMRFGEMRFISGQREAFDRVIEIVGPNINKETKEALMFLINEK